MAAPRSAGVCRHLPRSTGRVTTFVTISRSGPSTRSYEKSPSEYVDSARSSVHRCSSFSLNLLLAYRIPFPTTRRQSSRSKFFPRRFNLLEITHFVYFVRPKHTIPFTVYRKICRFVCVSPQR